MLKALEHCILLQSLASKKNKTIENCFQSPPETVQWWAVPCRGAQTNAKQPHDCAPLLGFGGSVRRPWVTVGGALSFSYRVWLWCQWCHFHHVQCPIRSMCVQGECDGTHLWPLPGNEHLYTHQHVVFYSQLTGLAHYLCVDRFFIHTLLILFVLHV